MQEEIKETKVEETKQEEPKKEEKVEEKAVEETQVAEKEQVEENKEEKVEEQQEQQVEEEPKQQEQVEEIPLDTAIRVEDIVTKDILADAISALSAKLDSIVKENQDLKDKLSKSEKDKEDLQTKYENRDFGTSQRVGVQAKDNYANDTFDNYAKNFM